MEQEQRSGQQPRNQEQTTSPLETGQLPYDLPEPRAEDKQQLLEGGIPAPSQAGSEIFLSGDQSEGACDQVPSQDAPSRESAAPQLHELQEGISQELPRAAGADEPETPEHRRRRLRNEARYRWNKQHPDKHREEVKRWQHTERGKEYQREYKREWRKRKKEQLQKNEESSTESEPEQ